jgi:hypothetical protein
VLGEKVDKVDNSNFRNSYELVTLLSSKKGKHLVEIVSIDEKYRDNKYELLVPNIKPKAINRNEQVDELFTLCNSDATPGAAVAVIKDKKG